MTRDLSGEGPVIFFKDKSEFFAEPPSIFDLYHLSLALANALYSCRIAAMALIPTKGERTYGMCDAGKIVLLGGNEDVAQFSLIRLSSVTHFDQRSPVVRIECRALARS